MKRTVLIGIAVVFCYMTAVAEELKPLSVVPVPTENPQTPAKVELGKKLFFDRRLSGDGTMSCATCHNPERAYTDGMEISLSYPTTRNWRNAPTLVNVGLFQSLFHDGRVTSLEEQALFPVMSAFEMNLNLDYLEEKIRVVPPYALAFREAFGGEVTRERIAMALAAFERSLVSVNAPLDRYLGGDKSALSADAQKGYALFVGKAKCVSCHNGALLSDGKYYALKVPENPEHQADPRITATRRFVAKVYRYPEYMTLNEDPGRYLITKEKIDWKAFRTPTLREIAKTAPYMHNGIYNSLSEVIDFFDGGGGLGNRVLKPLGLRAEEKRDIESFLREALSGEDQVMHVPEIP